MYHFFIMLFVYQVIMTFLFFFFNVTLILCYYVIKFMISRICFIQLISKPKALIKKSNANKFI